MKILRQLFRRARWNRSTTSRRTTMAKRRLLSQSLEQRQLLAGDVDLIPTNGWHPLDVNDDYKITALDANIIITELGRSNSLVEGEQLETEFYVDTNGDDRLTAADALFLINEGLTADGPEFVGELVELRLTARNLDDTPITPDASGDINVAVNEQFLLEVSYEDLRGFGADIGVFQLFTDISVSTGGVLQPVLNETQRLIFDGATRSASSGSFTFSLEGSATTYESQFGAFASDPTAEIDNALMAFGYTSDQYEISTLDFGNEATDPLGYEIRYTDFDMFGNVDLPDIMVADNLDVNADVTFVEFAPLNPDGTVNSDAVPFNLDTRSRTFNNNSEFYGALNRGAFDPDTGFTGVGGIGGVPTNGGGVPELSTDNDLIEPFDAFSLRVFLDESVTDFVVGVNPGEDAEATLLYGRNEPLPQDMVLIDEDANVTFNTVASSGPTAVARTLSFVEGTAGGSIDLLDGITDPDGDTVTLTALALASGDDSGVTISGSTVTVDPTAYTVDGAPTTIVYNYTVTDGTFPSSSTLTIRITDSDAGTGEAPVVNPNTIIAAFNENQGGTVDLLQNASDPDGDVLSVVDLASTGDAGGITEDGGVLTISRQFYNSLGVGESEVVAFTYNVSDGTNLTAASATITINGLNDAPVTSGAIMRSFSVNDSATSFSMLGNTSDPDGDSLSVDRTTISFTGDTAGVTSTANSLNVDPSAYSLTGDQSETITVDYTVVDGNGGSVAHQAVITISAQNLAPTAGPALNETFSDTDADTTVSLLTGASDPEGATLSVVNFAVDSGDASGITQTNGSVLVSPSAYLSLGAGESEVVVLSYDISDGSLTAAQTLTVTINGTNQTPMISAISETFNEDQAIQTVDLLSGSTDADGDTLRVVAASVSISGDTQGGVSVSGSSLVVDPSAYDALAAGESATITVTYAIVDDNGGRITNTATITITGLDEDPIPRTSVSGNLFIDERAPTRNGMMDAGESGLGGVTVSLTPAAGGETLTVVTDFNGRYEFSDVPEGEYILDFDIPEGVVYSGDASMPITAGSTPAPVSIAALGLTGTLNNLSLLSNAHLSENTDVSDGSNAGREGGSVAIDENGQQEMIVVGEGFDGIQFAELALNDAKDAALLTILREDGSTGTARLSDAHFVVSPDGRAVQFFGGLDDFDFFSTTSDILEDEFGDFRTAIDEILGN